MHDIQWKLTMIVLGLISIILLKIPLRWVNIIGVIIWCLLIIVLLAGLIDKWHIRK
jgi:hypothetical protein